MNKLEDGDSSKILVENLSGSFMELALTYLGKRSFFGNKSLFTRFLLKVMTLLKYMTSFFRLYLNLKGAKVGKRHTEFGIHQNQKVFLYGEFLYDKINKLLKG